MLFQQAFETYQPYHSLFKFMRSSYEQQENSDAQMNQDGKLQIGPFLFSNDISLILKRRLKHMYERIKHKVQTLRLQNGRLEEMIPEEALEVAESYTIQHLQNLQIANNKLENLSFFRKCNFPNLTVLSLHRNQLYSLTDIWNHANFPNLEQLNLHTNHITNVRGIKRWRLPQLNKLTFELNFIVSLNEITEAQLPALTELTLYSNSIGDLKPILRANFPKLELLEFYANPACNQRFINSIIVKKFFIEARQQTFE